MVQLDIDRGAPVIVKREKVIAASVELLWTLHTDIARWPSWQKDIATAELHGKFAAGSRFTWTTTGLDTPIVSTIYAVEPRRTVLWGGPSAGITGVHHWTFEPSPAGTHITTEESWSGPTVEAKPADSTNMLAVSLERWLDFLNAAAMS